MHQPGTLPRALPARLRTVQDPGGAAHDGPGRPPTPAVGRDAAQGGLGLHLVARICALHGWDVDGQREVAWCRIDRTPAGPPPQT